MSNHTRAQHIANEFVAFAIPRKQRGAGTAAAIHLEIILLLVPRDIDFVLEHARGPSHAHDVGFFCIAEADHDVGRVLSQVSVRPGNLKFLAIAARKHFHLGTDGALVVGQSLEREAQPVILIAAFIAQQHSRTVILRNQQVGRAVAIVIASDDGARVFELNFVETYFGGDVLETIGPEIAEEAHFALAFLRFADCDEVDPTVVVVIEGGDSEGSGPVRLGKFYSIERLPVIVTPKCDAGCAQVREGQIHPTIVIEVKNCDPRCL